MGQVVPSTTLTPGFALAVKLVSGDRSLAAGPRRALLLACKSSAGTITADTDLRQGVAGPDAVAALVGPGTPGHLSAKAFFAEYLLGTLDVIAPAASGGVAAHQTIVFDATSPVTVQQQVTIVICGRPIVIQWAAGMDEIGEATVAVAAINAIDEDLPLRAANAGGTSATVTLTAKIAGPWGNDVKLEVYMVGGTGGAITLTGANLTGGTTEPNPTTALGNCATRQYDLIINAITGNADAQTAASTTCAGRLKSYINAHNTGLSALLQQFVQGASGVLATLKVGVAYIDEPTGETIYWRDMRSLPCELAGAESGARCREETTDPNVNRCNRGGDMPYRATLYGPLAPVSSALNPTELEDALQSGIAAVVTTFNGTPFVSIPRTMYFLDTNAIVDMRVVYVAIPTSLYAIANDLRTYLPNRLPGVRIVKNLKPGSDTTPSNVVDERLVQALVVARVRQWCGKGVVDEVALDASVARGDISATVDPANGSTVIIIIDPSIIPPLTRYDTTLTQGPRS